MILLLALTILILSIGVVSANDLSQDNINLDSSSGYADKLDNILIISPMDNDQFSDDNGIVSDDGDNSSDSDSGSEDANSTEMNETDTNDSANDTNTSTGVITPEINDTINTSENVTPGVLSGKTYIDIVNDAFDLDELNDIPIRYDLRDYGYVTPVRDQSSSGSCWTFASIAAIESFLLKTEGVEYDFSENNMKNTMGSYGANGTDFGPNDGGNEAMILGYLLRWSGVVNETDDPYNPSSIRSPSNLTIARYVQDILWIPKRQNSTDNDQLKKAIMTYGAIYTGIYWDSTYEKGETYYYAGTYPYGNHAIAIVGWDDTYSASNFKMKPAGDGAFIIKNSWGVTDSYGNSVGKDGYYYVSYYDSIFAGKGSNEYFSGMAFTNIVNTTEYKSNYGYDPYGNTFDAVGYKNETAWFANQFTSDSNNPLKSIGFYTYGSSDYEAYIYVNDSLKYQQSGTIKGAGYHTILLNQYVNLHIGDIFRVAVKLTTPNCDYPIAIETSHLQFTSKASASANQSFVSSNGIAWQDLTTASGFKKANVCLKAYTTYAADLELNAASNVSYYSEGEEVEFVVNITNRGDLTSAEIYSDLDENVKIVSYETTKGIFDPATKIWTIGDMDENSSGVLKIVIQINTRQANITNSFNLSSSLYNMNRNSSSLELLKRISAKVSSSALATEYMSGEFLDVTIVNEEMNAITDIEVRFDVYNEDNQLIGTFYNVTDDEGKVYLLADFNAGSYSVKISLVDPYYEGELLGTIIVSKAKTELTALNSESILNKTTKINANVMSGDNPVNEGIVKFYVDGDFIGSSSVNDGTASIEYRHSKVGLYEIAAYYDANDNYLESDNLASLKVDKITASLSSRDVTSIYKDFNSFNISVFDERDNGIKGLNVLFNIYQNGNLLANNYILTDADGVASLAMDLTAGNYTVQASIVDNEYQGMSNNSITIEKATGKLTASQEGNLYNDTILNIKFRQAITNKAYANQKILVSFSNGQLYTVTTDANGEASLKLDIDAGDYTYQLYSANNNIVAKSAAAISIGKLDAKLSLSPVSKYYGEDTKLEAKVTDSNNNPLSNRNVAFKINNTEIIVATNDNGIAELDLDYDIGSYSVSASLADNNYNAAAKSASVSIKKIPAKIESASISKYYKNATQLEAKITDNNNNPLANKTLRFTYNGKIYERISDENGVAVLSINFAPGNYSFNVSLDDGIYEASEKTANAEVMAIPNVITAKNIVKYFKNSTQLSASLKDKDGNPLAGKKVTITIAGKTYTRTTDSKGAISFTLNLKAGTYTCKISFKETGYVSTSKSISIRVVSPKITIPAKTVKKGKYFAVNFKTYNGKVIKSTYVVIKIGSKAFKVKTNAKGNALVKVNLKKAKYKLVCSFASSKLYGKTTKSATIVVK